MLTKPKDIRAWWAGTKLGWIVDTEIGLSWPMMQRIVETTLHTQRQRLLGLLPGPVRDECLETIKALDDGRIQQNFVGAGEKVILDVYKSETLTLDMSKGA